MRMVKSYCAVLLLLVINFGNIVVMGQSTFGGYNNDEQCIVNGLSWFLSDFHKYYSDASVALTRSIQSEFQNLKAQIARLENRMERPSTCMNNSVQEIKMQMQTENIDIKAHLSRLDNRIGRHDTNVNNSLEEIKRQMQMENMEMKNEFQRLCQKLPRYSCSG